MERGERPDHDDVQQWARDNRFGEDDAHDLANMTDDVRYLRERLAPDGGGWGRPDAWFAEA